MYEEIKIPEKAFPGIDSASGRIKREEKNRTPRKTNKNGASISSIARIRGTTA